MQCPFRPAKEEGQEQQEREIAEEAETALLGQGGGFGHGQLLPNEIMLGASAALQVGMVQAITIARGIPVPDQLQEVAALTHATGGFEDVRGRQIPRRTVAVPPAETTLAGAESGPRPLELLAGLPGGDPSIPAPQPGRVPFQPGMASVAEAVVAHFFEQVQSEEVGAAKAVPARSTFQEVQAQSEEVQRAAVGGAAEFADFRQQAAALTILATLGVGMRGMERANLLGTQTANLEPVRNLAAPGRSVQGRPGVPDNIRSIQSGSGDFRNFGTQFRLLPGLQRTVEN